MIYQKHAPEPPAVIRERLIFACMFVTAHELLRSSIVDRIRAFYLKDVSEGGVILDPGYAMDVLARHPSVLYASLDWLVANQAINQADLRTFERIGVMHSVLTHELALVVTRGDEFELVTLFNEQSALLHKIETWWIVNIDTQPYSGYDEAEAQELALHGPIPILHLMASVANGEDAYFRDFQSDILGHAMH